MKFDSDKDIMLLDCTLRDGGYVNDWKFGNGNMTCILDRLCRSGVDIIEIGFLDDRRSFDMDRSIQPDTESLTQVYANSSSDHAMIVAMIDYGTCSLDHIQPCNETMLDGIRVIFKKDRMHPAIDFGRHLKELGYKVFLQMVSVTSYSDEDVREFTDHVNQVDPYCVSVVDTYGLMHKEQVFHYFELLDKYLNDGIRIGYHSHNNFQLGYSNTIEMLKLETERSVIIDGTLYGMGKSAGNAPLELLSMHLNDNYGKSYDINQILEAIDVNIMPIYEKQYWGYSLFFYISAKNDCHPNYVKYLLDKRTLSIKDVNMILSRISPELKLKYTEKHIESLYIGYLLDSLDDISCINALEQELSGRHILLIGPGRSSTVESERIKEYIAKHDLTVISVNFIPEYLDPDFTFVSNSKRYSLMTPALKTRNVRLIATSNITSVNDDFDYTVRYDGMITENNEIWDNALVILMNLLRKIGVGEVTLAGFDGFKKSVDENYIDLSFDLSKKFDYLSAVNELLKDKISKFSEIMKISFLTRSMYEA